MSRFCTFASSSKGNCAYLAGGGAALLIDAGCGIRYILQNLQALSSYADTLSGIVITHEHTDHIHGLCVLLKKLMIPVYGSPGTLEALISMGEIPPGATLIELTQPEEIAGIGVRTFSTPHDAADPVGYKFFLPDGRTVGVATDLGHVTPSIKDALTGCDLVLLESNYDSAMLGVGPYPWSVKRRIAGLRGHLSNEESASFAVDLMARGTTRFILAHLSVHNNYPDLAYQAVRGALDDAGGQEGVDYLLSVAPCSEPQAVITF